MKKILLLLLFITPFLGFSQTDSSEKKVEVFEIVGEQMPEYPGGEKARKEFIHKNLKYPKTALKEEKQGYVYVKFVVETDSSVSKVKVLRTFDKECGEEAVRITKMMRWIPGKQRGKAVRVWVTMPITFKLY